MKSCRLLVFSEISSILYGSHATPVGRCFIGLAPQGICHLSFFEATSVPLEILQGAWPHASLKEDSAKTKEFVERIFNDSKESFDLVVQGTPFQVKVWESLLKIPLGHVESYERMAQLIEKPKATRAVASAIARNSIAVLIPCHRVIAKSGEIHKYRWGSSYKKALLDWESRKKS